MVWATSRRSVARDYAMRIWLDPDKIASHNLTAGDVVAALRTQNVQVSAGVLAEPPVANPSAFQINVKALGSPCRSFSIC